MLPTEEEVGEGLRWCAENEDKYAMADARLAVAVEKLKATKAIAMPRQGTVAEREAEAYASAEWEAALNEVHDAKYDYTRYRLRYTRYKQEQEIWRTLRADQRLSVS